MIAPSLLGSLFMGGGSSSTQDAQAAGRKHDGHDHRLEDLELHTVFFLDHTSLTSLSCTCKKLSQKDYASCVLSLHLWKCAKRSNISILERRIENASYPQLRFLHSLHVTLDGRNLEAASTCLGHALVADHLPQLELLDICFNRYQRPKKGGTDPTVAIKESAPGLPCLLEGIAHALEDGKLNSLMLYKLDLKRDGCLSHFDLHRLRVLDIQFCHMEYAVFFPHLLDDNNPKSLDPKILQILRLPFVFELSTATDTNLESLIERLKKVRLPQLQLLDFTATRSGQWFSLRSPWEDLRRIYNDKLIDNFRGDHSTRVYRGLEF